ncbi:MAG: tetratricopeptide repeat protein, partial [Planctomycetales bacterium]|nr:tetratricopeptide repeat protein [Planctomycetales bacterium]
MSYAREKFRIDPAVVEVIRASKVTFVDIYTAVEMDKNTWRRLCGNLKDTGRSLGVPHATFVQFADAINDLMEWDKSVEELMHPDDRERFVRLTAIPPTPTQPVDDESAEPVTNTPAESNPTSIEPQNTDPPVSPIAEDVAEKPDTTRRPRSRRPVVWMIVAASIVLGLLGLSGILTTNQGTTANASSARVGAEPQDSPASSSESLTDSVSASEPEAEIAKTLKKLIEDVAIGSPRVDELQMTHRQKLLQISAALSEQCKGQPLLEADLRMSLGNAFYNHMEHANALVEFKRAAELRRESLGDRDERTLLADYSTAESFMNTGRSAEAIPIAKRVAEARQLVYGSTHAATVDSINQIARATMGLLDYQEAISILEDLLARLKADPHSSNFQINSTKQILAQAYLHGGKPEKSVLFLKEVLEYQRVQHGEDDPQTMQTEQQLGGIYHAMGNLQEAVSYLEKSCAFIVTKLGPTHPQTIDAKAGLANVYSSLGRDSEAEPLYLDVLYSVQQNNGVGSTGHTITLFLYAGVLRNLGRYGEAEAVLRHVIRDQIDEFGEDYKSTVQSLRKMASVFRLAGRYERELLWQVRTLRGRIQVHGITDPAVKMASGEL